MTLFGNLTQTINFFFIEVTLALCIRHCAEFRLHYDLGQICSVLLTQGIKNICSIVIEQLPRGLFTRYHSVDYGKNFNNGPMCYVVGAASSGKVWRFFVFTCLSEGLGGLPFAVFFAPFPEKGISDDIQHGSIIEVFTVQREGLLAGSGKGDLPHFLGGISRLLDRAQGMIGQRESPFPSVESACSIQVTISAPPHHRGR